MGYAIYFHCLELIAGDLSQSNLTFQLEHDSEIIADDLKIIGTSEKSGQDIVEEIMRYMVELGLFTNIEGRIYCFKLLHRLDSSMTSNKNFREMIRKAKHNHDTVMTPSCKKRIEEKRIDKKDILSGKPDGTPIKKQSKKRIQLIPDVPYNDIIDYFNKVCYTSFRKEPPSAVMVKKINERWREGFRLDDFKKVIDVKSFQWVKDDKMCKYLRPETLFSGEHFESYLNEVQ